MSGADIPAAEGIATAKLDLSTEDDLFRLGVDRVHYGRVRSADGARGFDVRLSGHGEVVRVVAYGTSGAPLALCDIVARAADLWRVSFAGAAALRRAASAEAGYDSAPNFARAASEVL